ncbi:SAM-dependent MidA family methyltransferase [Catenuloplanes nepalensis]|uniref:SAM-dependent MidA family methyltransferase n=1 Tax=Catenuloplanes nepalensis TaxID=587533 RepID=A0ABT9N3E5_9ACTN|nr:SAM-dependent methyltransferase [Catenuloplanes nepalensis]MDP9798223.1 SAM-dependent MidA family methyltransferase [Catenuloplanes nepalensis]
MTSPELGVNSLRWRDAMESALYGPDGFFTRPGATGPGGHFRTSAHATATFARALRPLLRRVDEALGNPDPFQLVDVGAGRGELLLRIARRYRADFQGRLRPLAVELAARPDDLPPGIGWTDRIPDRITGLLLATEWLDNVPVDVVEAGSSGPRYVLTDGSLGEPVSTADAEWLARWYPPLPPGARAEVGLPRDLAWSAALRRVERGVAVAVDYGHLRDGRPLDGTLTGYREGRQVPPRADGSTDVTAHVAMDSVAEAGAESLARTRPGGDPYRLMIQREALQALGADGRRPPLSLAASDPAGYVRALARASEVAELLDPAGLGGHWWLIQAVGVAHPFSVGDGIVES